MARKRACRLAVETAMLLSCAGAVLHCAPARSAPSAGQAARIWPGLGLLTFQTPNHALAVTFGGAFRFDGTLQSPDQSSRLQLSAPDTHSDFYVRGLFARLGGHYRRFTFLLGALLNATPDPAEGIGAAWIAHRLGSHGTVYVGQHKPWRSMDELASFSTMPFVERNALSANGLLGERNFSQGLYYDWAHRGLLRPADNLWLGASLYSNTKNDKGTAGYGLNGRIAYAPVLSRRAWLHLGASYSYDESPAYSSHRHTVGYGAPRVGDTTWYGHQGNAAYLVSFAAGAASSVATVEAELAGAEGPWYLQAEFGQARLQQHSRTALVDAYSVTAGYTITGETRPYRPDLATYGAITPRHRFGALELLVRYGRLDMAQISLCALAARATHCAVSSLAAGLNYFPNAAIRVSLDYFWGEADAGVAGTDRPSALEARAQLSF